jgi:hypothetical protein
LTAAHDAKRHSCKQQKLEGTHLHTSKGPPCLTERTLQADEQCITEPEQHRAPCRALHWALSYVAGIWQIGVGKAQPYRNSKTKGAAHGMGAVPSRSKLMPAASGGRPDRLEATPRIEIAIPLKSRLTINPTWRPLNDKTAPFSFSTRPLLRQPQVRQPPPPAPYTPATLYGPCVEG